MNKRVSPYFLFITHVLVGFMCLDSASATVPSWTPPVFAVGSLDINGSLNQKILLGRLTGSPDLAFPFHLAHRIRLGETASEYTVPQLTSYVAPSGRDSIMWVEPGGKRHIFKNQDILKKLPEEDDLPEDRWTVVSKQIGDYLFTSPNKWAYRYRAGSLNSLTSPTGRVLRFEAKGVHIAGIYQKNSDDGGEVELLTATHDDFGLLTSLKIGPVTHRFEYDDETEQLSKWFPASPDKKPVEFEYFNHLVFVIKLPGGDQLDFRWGTKNGNWQKSSGLILPEVDGPGAFLISDSRFTYRYGTSKEGINMLRSNKANQTDGLVWNPRTKQMLIKSRDGGEVTRLYGVRGAENGRLESVRDTEGRLAVSVRYDEKGRVIWRKTLGRPPRTFVYDELDRVKEVHCLKRRDVLYEYDGDSGRPVKITNTLGHSTQYRYNDSGQVLWVKGINGGEQSFEYDSAGRMVKHVHPYDYTETWKHDQFGRVIEYKGLDGKVVKKVFNNEGEGRRLAEIHSSDATWSYEYDPDGSLSRLLRNGETWQQIERENLVEGVGGPPSIEGESSDDGEASSAIAKRITSIDPTGSKSVIELDADGNVKKTINALGEETSFRRDKLGRLAGWTDARNVVAEFERDAIGRVTGLENDQGKALGMKYDKSGRIRERNTGERNISYQYDREGRLTRIDYGAPDEWVTREYDEYGRIKLGATAEVKTHYEYDELGRVVKRKEVILDQTSTTLEYEWGPGGRKSARTIYRDDKKLQRTDYRYDLLGRRKSIAIDGEIRVTYEYDPKTIRLKQKNFSNGMVVHYGWDKSGRPALLKAVEKNGTVTKDVSYQWSDHGKLNVRLIDGVQENYYYDKLGRLVAVIKNTLEEIAKGASVRPDPKVVAEMGIDLGLVKE